MDKHDLQKIRREINDTRTFWYPRNQRFEEWYEILILVDKLYTKGMESYVSSEPQTFYNMAHYLLTKGELSHLMPVESDSALELDRRARVHRACEYMWKEIDKERQFGGGQAYIDELGFFLLVLGWYGSMSWFDNETGFLHSTVWNPYDTFPRYAGGKLVACLHSYTISEEEAERKIEENRYWGIDRHKLRTQVKFDDYYKLVDGIWRNMVLMNDEPVTGWEDRPEVQLLVGPVGGFPDRGSLVRYKEDWKKYIGRSIFECNKETYETFNKHKSLIQQILRDTAQPITQEFSAVPQATPEQIRQRGAHFHYAPGEGGFHRVPPGAVPIELQGNLMETRREMQKGSFTDAVYGMFDVGRPTGVSLSMMASSSANQILYPYMDAKHFVISQNDRFWLSRLKTSKRVFQIKGHKIEKLSPVDIPEDVTINVESDVATPRDWMERGNIAGLLKDHVDEATIITEVLKIPDPQAIQRKKTVDRMRNHPMFQAAEMIAAARKHAEYLENFGDVRTARTFQKLADALEAQLGAPAPGQAPVPDQARVERAREAGAPAERPRVSPGAAPPEERGFTHGQLREAIERGTLRK